MKDQERKKNSSISVSKQTDTDDARMLEESGIWREQLPEQSDKSRVTVPGIYDWNDLQVLQNVTEARLSMDASLRTLDELLEKDRQREKDGFPRRIRIGKIVKPVRDKKDRIVIVPTTSEPKFLHDNSTSDEEESTGGSGDGEEGEVIGETPVEPEPGEGEGEGAGKGKGAEHDVVSDAFELGRILTEKFALPNLKMKGKKRALAKYTYELTDRNRAFGQMLDKKESLKQIIKTNILLGNLDPEKPVDTESLVINPMDRVYRILSREKDFETQAVVFFVRDYSGSMAGKPTEVVTTQHLFIYSWLMYQYQNHVETRFLLHDSNVREVPDFYTYHNSQVAGGTQVYPAYEKVNEIVEKENLAQDYNIYVFHGTDGDDWEGGEKQAVEALSRMLGYVSRIGITIARNSWSGGSATKVEKYLEESRLLQQKPELIKLDALVAEQASETRVIESIRKLIS